jgi:hypothetical protein
MQQQVSMCPRCGRQNYMGQRFCSGCGSSLTVACPYCGSHMSSSSGFCTNCGAQSGVGAPVGPGTQEGWGVQAPPAPVKEHKPASGWSKMGAALFVLGVLAMIAAPAFILLTMPEAEGNTRLLITSIAISAVAIIIGLPLMFKG